ncbi:glycoside hydrolase family 16 protein [Pedobacter hartonius]|uniref:Glycosyl hydrolases family 16 n=1 Tax=Pedobacter hartonius TaxID=425514 RepID=A0A1H4DUF7_9SPHI|nr:glycoside hydrolase family 16 protein [Pedobacter hartonius]SEA76413.1 Glycosyl hydrolases family 16 [Pedobacter hartonius]
MKKQFFTLKTAIAFLMFAVIATSCKKKEDDSNNLPESGKNAQSLLRRTTGSKAAFELVWSDEFDGTQLDSTKWTIVTGNQHVNNELQAYSADAVHLRSNGLVLTASKIPLDGQQYTSGKITTAGKFSILRGRIEAQISNANGRGLTSELTMQGINFPTVGLPQSGEIDIMQHKNNDTVINGGIQWDNGGFAVSRKTATSYPAQFDIYAVEWDENEIRYYVNDVLYNTINIANGVNGTDEFMKPFFINIDLTVGGNFAGNDIAPALPNSMQIDNIKVYKLIKP